jgi:hypothetical protein
MTKLEKLMEQIQWERKFTCTPSGFIVYAFREEDMPKAVKFFRRHKEETRRFFRTVYLLEDSLGQVLAITETPWDSI